MLLTKYYSKIARKNNAFLFIFPYLLCSGLELSNKEKYMTDIYYKQYNDFIGIGLFLSIFLLFFLLGLSCVSYWLFLLCLIPIFLYDIWFFAEYAIKRDVKKISFYRQADDLGNDWDLECQDRRGYSSFSWFKYL